MSAAPRVLVLGVGNLLWADEGFGVRCVEAFARRWSVPPGVELMDGGTQGLYLVQHIADAERVLVFDAVDFGAPDGTLVVVRDADVPSFIARGKMSLHQAGVADVLACAELLGRKPVALTVIGAQPVELEDYGGSLTPTVRALVPRAVELAAEELRAWGVELVERTDAPPEVIVPALSIEAYESGRPSADAACRHGDERVLAAVAPGR
ncbi:MAG: HyaD/HybD family hydrogenase maturation endopeptidase [Xanthomonadaceae bacterium]|jgi:hydrogenase maturation protease|nr:HyaD/HybD family hydrogenase maturation endopeptidase [Xanthomonadaceae bacterium]